MSKRIFHIVRNVKRLPVRYTGIMKLYTKQGDKGKTALFGSNTKGENCVRKDDPQVVCYGAIDALSAQLGLLTSSQECPELICSRIQKIQHRIFDMGSHVAVAPEANEAVKGMLPTRMNDADVAELELWIDESEADLPKLTTFILPGGHKDAAQMHVARVATRHLEGLMVSLHELSGIHLDLSAELKYINRLSDLFFSWARWINLHHKIDDVTWQKTR